MSRVFPLIYQFPILQIMQTSDISFTIRISRNNPNRYRFIFLIKNCRKKDLKFVNVQILSTLCRRLQYLLCEGCSKRCVSGFFLLFHIDWKFRGLFYYILFRYCNLFHAMDWNYLSYESIFLSTLIHDMFLMRFVILLTKESVIVDRFIQNGHASTEASTLF